MQEKGGPLYIRGNGRRHFQALERPGRICRFADVHADISSSHQRAEPGDVAAYYPGPDDPETGILDKEGFAVPPHLGGHYNVGSVLGYCNVLHFANLHFLVLYFRLASLQSLAGLEGYRNCPPALKKCVDCHGAADESRDYRDNPDQLD